MSSAIFYLHTLQLLTLFKIDRTKKPPTYPKVKSLVIVLSIVLGIPRIIGKLEILQELSGIIICSTRNIFKLSNVVLVKSSDSQLFPMFLHKFISNVLKEETN